MALEPKSVSKIASISLAEGGQLQAPVRPRSDEFYGHYFLVLG